METFNLWNPYRLTPRILEFDTTPTEVGVLKDGTLEWISHCLSTWEVKILPTQWSVVPFRSNFYSDYPSESEWEDRWPVGWQVRVEFNEDIPVISAFSNRFPVSINALDLSVESGYEAPHYEHTVLLASEFAGTSGISEKIQAELVRLAKASLDEAPRFQFSVRILSNQNWQLRMLVENIELPACIPTLDNLRDYLEAEGGAITWRHAFDLKPPAAALDVHLHPISSNTLEWSQDIPSEHELRVIFRSEQPGLFGSITGADRLARTFDTLEPTANRPKLAKLIAALVMDKEVRARSGAIRFFQQRPNVPDDGILSQAFELRSPLFVGIEAEPPELSGDLQSQLARSLAERAKIGDALARETLRREALRSGCGESTIVALFLTDQNWLFEKANDIAIRTPEIAVSLVRKMVRQQQDLLPFLLSVGGYISQELLERALREAAPENLEDYLTLLTGR